MKHKLLLFTTLACLAVLQGHSQILGPTTATVGTPVTFSSAVNGQYYTWVTDTMNYSGDFTPTALTLPGTGADNFVKMVKEGNNYYAFYFTGSSNMLRRMDFGTNPNSMPTLNANVVAVPDVGGSNNKAIEIVRDSATGNWYGFFAGNRKLCRADFGTSITSTPTITTIMNLPAAASVHGGDFVVVKDNGNWYGFLACNLDPPDMYGIIRIKFGSSLTNNSPQELTPSIKKSTGDNRHVSHFALHRENGKWYMLATQLNDGSSSGSLFRFDLGTSLESTPSDATVILQGGFLGGNQQPRSVIVLPDCNELVVYVMNANTPYASPSNQGMFVKFDFQGSILNTPVITRPTGANNLNVAVTNAYPYVYNDSLYLIGLQWQGGTSWTRFKLMGLPAGKHTTKYIDSSFTHTFTAPGTYNITLNVEMGSPRGPRTYCHQVTVAAPPPAQPGNFLAPVKTSVCKGETVAYLINRVTDATSYNWSYSPATGVTITQVADTHVLVTFANNAGNGTLSVTANNAGGASPARTQAITVNDKPSVLLGPTGSQTICQGTGLQLTAAATGVNYQWLNGNSPVGTNASIYTATAAGTYRVAVTSASTGCADTSASVTVTVNSKPSVSVSPTGSQAICQGSSLQLTATASGVNYRWLNGNSAVGTNASTYTATAAGGYRVEVTSTATGCKDTSATVTVTVNSKPSVVLNPTGSQAICQGSSLQLTATATGVNYQWLSGNSPVGTNTSTYTTSTAGTYKVEVTSTATGCKDTSATVTVTVNPLPPTTLNHTGQATICVDDSLVLEAPAGYSYQWRKDGVSLGAGSVQYAAKQTGVYEVEVSDANCSDISDPVDLTVLALPVLTLTPNDTAFCDGGSVMLEVVTADTGLTYIWERDGVVVPLATADFLSVQDAGTYVVTAERALLNGCAGSTNPVIVTVHPLPVVNIDFDGQDLHATPGFASYQWALGTQPIAGATDSVFRPAVSGNYRVDVTDANGCTGTGTKNITTSVSDVAAAAPVKVFPNPAANSFTVQAAEPVTLRLFGMDGKLIRERMNVNHMEIGDLSDGIYLLQVHDAQGRVLLRERMTKSVIHR
jgi:hypothetical protein